MKKLFRPEHFTTVADGTQVSAFLNANDANNSTARDIPASLAGNLSVAAGRIGVGVTSAIHAHPVVTQVIYVTSGEMTVLMMDRLQSKPNQHVVPSGSTIVSEPGTLLQLCNHSEAVVEVLYIVSPAYVFEADAAGQVFYDDAVLVAQDWQSLSEQNWNTFAGDEAKQATHTRRAQALQRQSARRKATGS
jgi:quercetin dioxygenase-like cupin family protein